MQEQPRFKIVEEEFLTVENHLVYLQELMKKHKPKRQAYIEGCYVGYDYGYGTEDGYDYYFGWHYRIQDGYSWKDIDVEEKTTELVRDIQYEFKFYKMNSDNGKVQEKTFQTLKEVEQGYHYFKKSDCIQTVFGNPYYLNVESEKTNFKIKKSLP